VELEVVLRPGQSEVEGRNIATALLSEFGIGEEHLIAEAYVDLLARQAGSTENQPRCSRSIADRGSSD
jgi:adenylate cyclase class IV